MKKTDISDTEKYGFERKEIIKNKKIARSLDVFFGMSFFYMWIGLPLVWHLSGVPWNTKENHWWLILGMFNIPLMMIGGMWLMARYPPFYGVFIKITRPLVWIGIIIAVSVQIAKLIG